MKRSCRSKPIRVTMRMGERSSAETPRCIASSLNRTSWTSSPTVTLAHYEQHAEEFRAGTRDQRRQPEHCFAIDTAAAPQWLGPNSDLGRVQMQKGPGSAESTPRCFTEKKPITVDIA